MEIKQDLLTMLELLQQPAFLVQDGIICRTNIAAGVYLLQPGTPVETMIPEAKQEYATFTEGSLSLAVEVGGVRVGACVTCMEQFQLFTLEHPAEQVQLQAMALSAQHLRKQLAGYMSAVEQLVQQAIPEQAQLVAQIHHRSSQALRTIGNMSDAMYYAQPENAWTESTELCAFLEEILEKAAFYGKTAGIDLRWQLPNQPVYTMVDREKLERALLNMLANAMKYGGSSDVQVLLAVHNDRVRLSVSGYGETALSVDAFQRYMRKPMLDDARNGVGLGMVLIRGVAMAHGGAVLLDQPEPNRNRITLTLPLQKVNRSTLRTPVLDVDYAGEVDHVLLELSEVLPAEAYLSEI